MTLKETEEYLLNRILVQYPYHEAKSIAKIALQHLLKLSNINYSLNYSQEVPQHSFSQIHQYINSLQWGTPIQYIIGEAHFMGFDFIVSPDVLIPRRETEELVDLIIREQRNKDGITIADIGTGSGCIAITLRKHLFKSKVYALDISDRALDIAQRNAIHLKAEIEFLKTDILKTEALLFDTFDVIVSNPPYVTLKEKNLMHTNVVEHEPHSALFVPDDDALLFYKKIILLASHSLNKNGKLYFEINENFGVEVRDLMLKNNFKEVQIIKDMQGKDRIVKGETEK